MIVTTHHRTGYKQVARLKRLTLCCIRKSVVTPLHSQAFALLSSCFLKVGITVLYTKSNFRTVTNHSFALFHACMLVCCIAFTDVSLVTLLAFTLSVFAGRASRCHSRISHIAYRRLSLSLTYQYHFTLVCCFTITIHHALYRCVTQVAVTLSASMSRRFYP